MRIALFHDLPAGGAKRTVDEMVARSSRVHEYTSFAPEALSAQPRSSIRAIRDLRELSDDRARHQTIAPDIDQGSFDCCLVHPSKVTQAPMLLTMLETPTVYFMQEPRRRSYEKGYGRLRDRRSAVRERARDVWDGVYNRLVQRIDEQGTLAAGTVVTNSYHSMERIRAHYGRYASVCHLGVNEQEFALRSSVRERAVVSVGGIEPAKGHVLIAEALGLFTPPRPTFHVVYERREAAYERHLVDTAERAGVDLRLHSEISDEALVDIYGNSAVTVCAGELEPFGLSPLESMSCGTPVVAVAEGGYRETVSHGINGLLVSRSSVALAAGIAAVMEMSLKPARVRDSILPYFSWDAATDRLHGVLDEVISEQSRT